MHPEYDSRSFLPMVKFVMEQSNIISKKTCVGNYSDVNSGARCVILPDIFLFYYYSKANRIQISSRRPRGLWGR